MNPKRLLAALYLLTAMVFLAACGQTTATTEETTATTAADTASETTAGDETTATTAAEMTTTETTATASSGETGAASLAFDNSAWNYDADNDVYWQIGVQYVANPATLEYETLGIYVPGAYVTATDNGNGTYTVAVDAAGTVNGYTAATAPIVFPVNTPGYSAQAAPTSYSYDEIAGYLQAGFIYVQAGMRGRNNGYDDAGNLIYSGGAPWGVTDLKAAVRYYRYNQSVLPGNTGSIFVFGMSGGGAQSAVMGASGDSELYYPYLEAIGAAMTDATGAAISDAISGVMAWCPITSLDYADEAYEWNMGQYATSGVRADGTWTAALSDDMAEAYAAYINAAGLTDENGNVLTLTTSDSGIYAAGSYYDYLLAVVEQSLNNFLADTTFPYTPSAGGGFMGGGPGGGTPPDGATPPEGGTPPEGMTASDDTTPAATTEGATTAEATTTSTEASSTTYETAQAYIDSLNATTGWIVYDAATNTATITSLADFATYAKTATKNVPAFDDLNRSQAENYVFGNDDSDALHFSSGVAALLAANEAEYATYADWDAAVVEAYATDLQAVDSLGNGITYRMNMYNPMYYLLASSEGYGTATPASHWRIRTGIEQGDTALTVEANLNLALQAYESVQDVDFATVWAQGHTTAERSGDSTTNFITWVNELVGQ